MAKERLAELNLNKDDEEISDECFNNIIKYIEDKNYQDLKQIFSPNILKESDNINNGIKYIMDFYKGKMKSRSEVTLSRSDFSEDGKQASELRCMYTVETNEDRYIIFFIKRIKDTKDSNNIGISMLQVIKESDKKNEFDAGGKKTRCAGIYIPDSEK